MQAAIDEYGRIDILVCNAGVGWKYGEENPGTMAGVHEASLENWRDVIGGVDLEGYFTMIHAALPHMLEQESGSIVSVASMAGLTGLYDAHAYTAAKGAIINLTRSMGITYAKQGVRANCVCPGFIDTPMIEPAIDLFNDEATNYAMVPMGRAGRPEEMAYAILYLGLRRGRATAPARPCWPTAAAPRVLPGCEQMNSVPIDQLEVGDAVESRKTISESDVYLFAGVTGDFNPVHVDAEFAKTTLFGARVAHGPLTFSLCAGLLGTELPGLGTSPSANQVRYQARSTSATRSPSGSRSRELDPERNRATMAGHLAQPGRRRRSPRADGRRPPARAGRRSSPRGCENPS